MPVYISLSILSASRQQDPNLWVQALGYFARKEENCKQQIMEVLAHILFVGAV